MSWNLVAKLSGFGLLMSVATVYVVPPNVEPVLWLLIFLVCAALIALHAPGKHFLHGLCTSLLNSVWITTAHIIFFDAYIARHAQEAAMSAQMGSPRLVMALTGPVVGLVSGLVLGTLAFVASKLVKPAAAARTA
jgi:hypothetical protein